VRPVLAPDDAPERAGLVPPVLLRGLHDVLELHVHAGGPPAADALQRRARGVGLPAQHQAVGRVRDERRAHQDDGGRDDAHAEGQPPAPHGDGVGAVVHQVGREHAHVQEQVEDAGERPAAPRRRDLRQVHRRGLVREPHGEAEEDAADDEHSHVDGGAVEHGADEEERGPDEHRVPPPNLPGDVAGDQAREHAGEVQRRDKCGEQLAVEDAVLVLSRVVHLLQDVGEEGLQERLHLRQPT